MRNRPLSSMGRWGSPCLLVHARGSCKGKGKERPYVAVAMAEEARAPAMEGNGSGCCERREGTKTTWSVDVHTQSSAAPEGSRVAVISHFSARYRLQVSIALAYARRASLNAPRAYRANHGLRDGSIGLELPCLPARREGEGASYQGCTFMTLRLTAALDSDGRAGA